MAKSVDFEVFLDPPPVTIAQIDEEIQKHRAAIIHLRRRRNSLVPVSRLPPEVLSAIFLFNVMDRRSTFEYWFNRPTEMSYCWINITYVCHYWREIALNDPKLWSFWGNITSRWFKEFNSRSKAAPLHVRLTDPPLTTLNHIFKDPDVRDRLHELHVDMGSQLMSALVGHLNSTSMNSSERALAIRSLRIRIRGPSYAYRTLHSLSCKLPHLWRLELAGCLFDWDSPVFIYSNLTHLKLHQNKFGTQPTIVELLSILEKQPNLENLDLGFSAGDPPPSGVATNVHIPRLQKLRLSGPSSYCFDLATHISYPSTSTLVNFQVRLAPESMHSAPALDYDSRILDFLSRHYGSGEIADSSGNIEPPTIRRLSFKVNYCLYDVDLWLNTGLGDPSSLLPLCHIEIRCGRPSSESAFQTMSKNICEILPLTHLHRLDVAGLDVMSKGWSKILGVMDKLEEMKIKGQKNVVAAINALRPYPQRKTDTRIGIKSSKGKQRRQAARHYVPLPNLHRLHIVDVNFNIFGVSNSDFSSCLEARKLARRGLSLLVLRRCESVSSSMLETYICRGIAAVVDWDESSEFDRDDDSSSEYYSDSSS